jgi:hypothetical protein
MSYVERKSFDKLPNDIILQLIPLMDQSSRLNLALAFPQRFLNEDPVVGAFIFNIFRYDAEQQVLKHSHATSAKAKYIQPILYTAIKNGTDIPMIKKIINQYKEECPASINGIWGQHPIQCPPPLFFAATLGRPLAVSLLLNEGADSTQRYGNEVVGTADPGQTAIEGAMKVGFQIRSRGSIEHRAIEDCASILYAREPSIHDPVLQLVSLGCESPVALAVKAGFLRLAKAILEPADPTVKRDLQTQLHLLLSVAIKYQRSDADRDMVEYLVSIGAPLVDSPQRRNLRRRFDDTLVKRALNKGHPNTAAFLLDLHVDQNVRFDFGWGIDTRGLETKLPFVKALYRAMSREGNYFRNVECTSTWLCKYLLTLFIGEKTKTEATAWLIEQGVSTVEHLWHAVTVRNIAAINSLLEAGHPIDATMPIHPDEVEITALEYALSMEDWNLAHLLRSRGADLALVSETAKLRACGALGHTDEGPYSEIHRRALFGMLEPEYFGTQLTYDELLAKTRYQRGLLRDHPSVSQL